MKVKIIDEFYGTSMQVSGDDINEMMRNGVSIQFARAILKELGFELIEKSQNSEKWERNGRICTIKKI